MEGLPGPNMKGWDKEPWMLEGTEFAESYRASPDPMEWFKNIEAQGLTDKLEEALREKAYADSDGSQSEWDYMVEDLTNLMESVSPGNTVWRVNMRGFGWMKEDADGTITAKTGEELLRAVLPNTDCSFKIYRQGKGIEIANSHHDGSETYYITPMDATPPNPEPTPRSMQLAVAPEMADQLNEHHDKALERNRPKETGFQDPAKKITPEMMEDAPETTFDIPTMQPRDRQRKLDDLLDQYNAEQDETRKQQLEEQMRSLRASMGGWLKQASDVRTPDQMYETWISTEQGQEDWNEAYASFPRYNTAQSYDAAEYLIDRCEEWCLQLMTPEEFEAMRESLFESIHAGLT